MMVEKNGREKSRKKLAISIPLHDVFNKTNDVAKGGSALTK
jgi:hypothetical protein